MLVLRNGAFLALLVIVEGLVHVPTNLRRPFGTRTGGETQISGPQQSQTSAQGWGASLAPLNTNPRRIDVGEENMSKFGKVRPLA